MIIIITLELIKMIIVSGFFRGYFAEINVFRELEYNSFKNLPKTNSKRER